MGRPPKWTDPTALAAKIEEYFELCKGVPYIKEDGEALLDKNGDVVLVDKHPPTMSGLALHLGFTDRKQLLDYKARPQFTDVIKGAKLRIERYAEERLFDRDGARGAEFSLKYNFKWAQEEQDAKNAAAQGVVILPAIIEPQDDEEKR